MNKKTNKGFTLMETVVALGIAAVALSFFVAAFAPASLGIKKAGSVQEAKLLASALEAELNTFRQGSQDSAYGSSFEKAFNWIQFDSSNLTGDYIIAFRYRADATLAATDGVIPGYTGSFTNSLAQPMVIQNRVTTRDYATGNGTPTNSNAAALPIDSIEGDLFIVELTQLVHDNTGATTVLNVSADTTSVQSVDDATGNLAPVTVFNNFLEPTLLVEAKFYKLESNSSRFLQNLTAAQFAASQLVYTTKFGIMR